MRPLDKVVRYGWAILHTWSIKLAETLSLGEKSGKIVKMASGSSGPEYAPVYGQWMELDIPPQTPANRAFWLVLSLWRKRGDDYLRQAVRSSDLELLTESQVVLGELVIPSVFNSFPGCPAGRF